jgi:hypothetical protein
MPNILAHIGVQGLATGVAAPRIGTRWVLLACVAPDVPWMFQRAIRAVLPHLDTYAVRAYAVGQASLVGTTFLLGAIALIGARPRLLFGMFTLNAVAHLVLDAAQTKWANGVHFFAPLTWEAVGIGWFWPESVVAGVMTLSGLAFVVTRMMRHRGSDHAPPLKWVPRRFVAVGAMLVMYIVLPISWMPAVEAADSHWIGTLRAYEDRPGRRVEFDRAFVRASADSMVLETFAREHLAMDGIAPERQGKISIRGRFVTPARVLVETYHFHAMWFRGPASYIGLVFLVYFWLAPVILRVSPATRARRDTTSSPNDDARVPLRPA